MHNITEIMYNYLLHALPICGETCRAYSVVQYDKAQLAKLSGYCMHS